MHSPEKKNLSFSASLILGFLFFLLAPAVPVLAYISNGQNASDLLGQYDETSFSNPVPVYTKSATNNGPNKFGFSSPQAAVLDSVNHRLFVSDGGGAHRVLVYNLDVNNQLIDRVPDNVLGQSSFGTGTAAVTQAGLSSPRGLAYDPIGNRLFVGQPGGQRISVFDVATITDGENAINVLGQTDFTTSSSGTTQSKFNNPGHLAYDSATSRLFAVDGSNNRVLIFDVAAITDGENAINVLGQADFTTPTAANTQAGLSSPQGVAYDATNSRLFVSQTGNHRVTVYDVTAITDGENAINVLGQTTFTATASGDTQSGMNSPQGLSYDSTNSRLFVGQSGNNRVTVYDVTAITDGENAINVLGQTTFTATSGATTQGGMSVPFGVLYDSDNSYLYTVASGNRRITIHDVASITNGENAIDLLGQYDETSFTDPVPLYTKSGNNNAPNKFGFNTPRGIALDSVNHRLFVSDGSNNRVFVYNLNVDGTLIDHVPDNVIGQADFASNAPATTQSGLNTPQGLAYDPIGNRLFVAQSGISRVTVYDVAAITDGENAINVLGQTTFTSGTSGNTQAKMNSPIGLAYDAANSRLFVGQTGNHRVTVYDVAAITDGEDAINVLGQATFTATAAANTQSGMSTPQGLVYDSTNSRLFVAQSGNNRVTVYDVAAITDGENAINVLGQTTFTATSAANTQDGMSGPIGLAYDATNSRLFVGQTGNHRVTVYDVAAITDGENAINVLGQTDFTTTASATTQSGMNTPQALAYDSVNTRLFLSQTGNHRVTAYDIAPVYSLLYAAGANGSLTGTTSQSVIPGADGTAVTAVPDTGYHFVDWSDASTENPRTDTNVNTNISVTANFAINTYTLTYTAGAGGSVSGTTPQTVNYGSDGSAVTAVPDSGYAFTSWSDASTENPRTDTGITSDLSVSASFVAVDSDAPTISAVSAEPDTTYAVISWTTSDELSSSIVDYGPTASYGVTTVEADTSPRVTDHAVIITDLPTCATIHYRVKSKDVLNNLATGSDNSFTTLGCTGSSPIIAAANSSVDTGVGGSALLSDGGAVASLTIPAGFSDENANFQIKRLVEDTVIGAIGSPASYTSVGNNVYEMRSITETTELISVFDVPITVTLSYTADDIVGVIESSLRIFRWNGSSWNALSNCSVDTSLRMVTCETGEFSTFALFGSPLPSSSVSSSTPAVSLPVLALLPPRIPNEGFQILINGGAPTSSSRAVTLSFNAGSDVRMMSISENPDFAGGVQEPYSNQKNFVLSSGEGVKKIFVKFYTAYGQASFPVSAEIHYLTSNSQSLFVRTLSVGKRGADVLSLQKLLNTLGFTVARSGSGAPGRETEYFGTATRAAVIRFQEANRKKIFSPTGSTAGRGLVGPATRAVLRSQGWK